MSLIKSLYYHAPSVRGFEKMIQRYLNNGYRFVDASELFSILNKRQKLVEKIAFISFRLVFVRIKKHKCGFLN